MRVEEAEEEALTQKSPKASPKASPKPSPKGGTGRSRKALALTLTHTYPHCLASLFWGRGLSTPPTAAHMAPRGGIVAESDPKREPKAVQK